MPTVQMGKLDHASRQTLPSLDSLYAISRLHLELDPSTSRFPDSPERNGAFAHSVPISPVQVHGEAGNRGRAPGAQKVHAHVPNDMLSRSPFSLSLPKASSPCLQPNKNNILPRLQTGQSYKYHIVQSAQIRQIVALPNRKRYFPGVSEYCTSPWNWPPSPSIVNRQAWLIDPFTRGLNS